MRSQRMILGIRWHDFVRNTEVVDRTNLPCVQDIIAKRRNSLFGHVVTLYDRPQASPPRIIGGREIVLFSSKRMTTMVMHQNIYKQDRALALLAQSLPLTDNIDISITQQHRFRL